MFLHLLWSRRVGYLWTAYTEQSVEAFFGLKAGQTDIDDVQIVALLLDLLKLGRDWCFAVEVVPTKFNT